MVTSSTQNGIKKKLVNNKPHAEFGVHAISGLKIR